MLMKYLNKSLENFYLYKNNTYPDRTKMIMTSYLHKNNAKAVQLK